MIWKQHHSVCDGASIISYINATGDTYDLDAMIPIRKVPLYKRLLLFLGIPFYLPGAMLASMKTKMLKNPLHDGKRDLSGQRHIATSKLYEFSEIKEAAHRWKETINDFTIACMACALKEYFIQAGDSMTDRVNIIIPANIRFGHYQKVEDIRMENHFSVVPLTIPLRDDLKASIQEVPRITRQLHSGFGPIYATYIMVRVAASIFPHWLMQKFINFTSKPFTLAYSNVPGLFKPSAINGAKQIMG